MDNKRPTWTSRYSFILAAIGSAVGLGNIWRFPYVMGQNGGAVFLLAYVLFIVTICFIPLMTEILVGKKTKKDCVGAFELAKPELKYLGMLNPITAIIVPSFYFVIGGWIINYTYKSFIGFQNDNPIQYFSAFTQAPVITVASTLLFLFICIFFLARGVKKGIEFINNVMMPLLAIILVILVIASINLPNAYLGLEYIFKPDFSKVSGHMLLSALGQAFFTLSVGMGSLLTYGSYIKSDKNIVKSAYTIIFSSTTFSILAGMMIFPAVFSFGLEPDSGAGLVFVTLPKVFMQIPHGNIVACAFFILLFCAAITSGISMLEVPCATLVDRLKISRLKAGVILFCIIALITIPATLSFGLLKDFKLFDKTIFDLLDFTASNILLPLNTLFVCLIGGWFLKIRGELIFKNKFLISVFNIGLRYVVPIFLIGLFIIGLR
ncbi:sodium-dependent transporter [bacterium]|nr:sodium-dependent transporter [bacterium]